MAKQPTDVSTTSFVQRVPPEAKELLAQQARKLADVYKADAEATLARAELTRVDADLIAAGFFRAFPDAVLW